MSIFGKIMSSIFGGSAHAASAANATPADIAAAAKNADAAVLPAGPTPMAAVDVTAVMDKLAEAHDEDLDWRKSIVDLMKLVGMDSSLTNRKELAKELGYTASTSDSAAMNMWLHKQVMTKIASNGGTVPKELLD